ncbi:MAG: LysR family transcriptional regulator [Blastocatellia bacterium]|nr:LysR family transcriptional regulator [Blastocatellia bacterium]MCS7157968.1 LysR family transcriptional regulator [Blastocatellia bacterium]MCX7752475.1 LysR family transcriptional regulator [Blastocatellia bacterium]MDW8167410.1 LysR family transcriptional regulator [Acidobacteriota bacterium]MDW8257412.1 LysR family transcriptional regulator [Acidobacteriota bacterium]
MELRHLRTFRAVAETGSFTLAGRRVNLSQAAVSLHIKALEEELGMKLFARVRKRATLTPAGRALLKHAQAILSACDLARTEIAALAEEQRIMLRVGTASTVIAIHPLPEILSELKKRFPLLDLVVFAGTSEAIVRRLLEHRLDVGLISLPVEAPLLQTEPLYGDRLVAVVPPGHPLAQAREVTVMQLAAEPLILGERGGNRRRIIDLFFEHAGVRPHVAMELNRDEAIKKMVEVGLGVSILPWLTVQREVHAGLLRALPIRGLKSRWELGVAYRKEDALSEPLVAFLELCRAYLGKGGERKRVVARRS